MSDNSSLWRRKKIVYLPFVVLSGSNVMGGKFWSLLEISWDVSLDTYIHHFQLNWIT